MKLRIFAVSTFVAIAACSSSGAGGLEKKLEDLGVSVEDTPRLGDDLQPVPDDYVPMGSTFELTKTAELFFAGMSLQDPGGGEDLTTKFAFLDAEPATNSVLFGEGEDQPAWAQDPGDERSFTRSTRGVTAADVDGDGREEVAVVFVDRDDPSSDMELKLVVIEDAEHSTPFETTETLLVLEPNIEDIALAAADMDGDGLDDFAVGITTNAAATLMFVDNDAGTFTLNSDAAIPVALTVPTNVSAFRIAAGNLDYDRGEELAVILNESDDSSFDPVGISNYLIIDDASAGRAVVGMGRIETTQGGVAAAEFADVAVGDIDGDRIDEIVMAGLADYVDNCDLAEIVVLAIDDGVSNFASMGDDRVDYFYPCQAFNPTDLRWLHVNTLDTDGNRLDEIAVSHIVFDNFRDSAPWTELYNNGEDSIIVDQTYVDRSTTQAAVGDINADGRDDLLLFNQQADRIDAFGLDVMGNWVLLESIETEFFNTQSPQNALLVPVNVDSDSIILRYGDAEHRLVFTEPIVLAALAAPPCQNGVGQNQDDCFTTFGTATSQSVTTEQVLSVSASASVGINIDGGVFTQSELEIKATVTATASQITSSAYTLTKSVVFTTGANEDSVIFTTLPYDQYVYEVVSHPDTDLIGTELVVSLPREPITLLAERSFYNDTVEEDDLKIDAAVFTHTVGDTSTYPGLGEKNGKLGTQGGLENGPQSVGQGSGSVELGLAVGEEYSEGNSLEVGFEFSVEATGGTILGGFSVGASAENSLVVTSGTETSYTGSIGNIPANNFSENQYSYGMYTYVQSDIATGQQFQVVNYWVE